MAHAMSLSNYNRGFVLFWFWIFSVRCIEMASLEFHNWWKILAVGSDPQAVLHSLCAVCTLTNLNVWFIWQSEKYKFLNSESRYAANVFFGRRQWIWAVVRSLPKGVKIAIASNRYLHAWCNRTIRLKRENEKLLFTEETKARHQSGSNALPQVWTTMNLKTSKVWTFARLYRGCVHPGNADESMKQNLFIATLCIIFARKNVPQIWVRWKCEARAHQKKPGLVF